MLPGASRYWIADCFEVYENGVATANPKLPNPHLDELRPVFRFLSGCPRSFRCSGSPAGDKCFVGSGLARYPVRIPFASGSFVDCDPAETRRHWASESRPIMKYVEPDGGVRDFSFEGDPGMIYLDARLVGCGKAIPAMGISFRTEQHRFSCFSSFAWCFLSAATGRLRRLSTAFAGALSVTLLASAFGLMPGRNLVSSSDRNAQRHFHTFDSLLRTSWAT